MQIQMEGCSIMLKLTAMSFLVHLKIPTITELCGLYLLEKIKKWHFIFKYKLAMPIGYNSFVSLPSTVPHFVHDYALFLVFPPQFNKDSLIGT